MSYKFISTKNMLGLSQSNCVSFVKREGSTDHVNSEAEVRENSLLIFIGNASYVFSAVPDSSFCFVSFELSLHTSISQKQ